MATYFITKYDTQAGGEFTAKGTNVSWTGSTGFIITDIPNAATATEGLLYCALISGSIPTDGQTLTQGAVTADPNGDGLAIAYAAYMREDVAVAAAGTITWTGPAIGATHSFYHDGDVGSFIAGEILTFDSGETAEVITVGSGELDVRFISNVDVSLPADDEPFNNGDGDSAVVNGVIHDRVYSPLELHRFLQDLNDNGDIVSGGDDLSRVDPIASSKDTGEIVNLLGNMEINEEVSQHMYGGSISQDSGNWIFSGLNVQVTSPNSDTQPVLIKYDSIITDYWKNAYMPHSIDGGIRLLVETKKDGVAFDGQRIKGKLSEFGDNYFTGGTTLGLGWTALALFSSTDGNNTTAVATVAGAPYSSIVITEGYQTIDYQNGNGATPFGFKIDFGSASSPQTYERTKYVGRRGTAETLFTRDATYFDGINLNFAYDGESGGPLLEDEIVAWGTVITYDTQTVNLTVGEVVTFSGGSRGRLIYMDDGGATGTLIFDMDGNALPVATETMTGLDSAGDGTIATIGTNTAAGTGTLIALNDGGTTGNLYISRLTGILPVNDSEIYGATSNALCVVNGTPESRTVNNQFWGIFTGTNHQTNFGLGLDASDAIVGDKFPNLLGTTQAPPDSRKGQVTSIKIGDTITVYPWDGTSTDVNGDAEPNFDEATLTTALTVASTEAVVSAIPVNTPSSGFLRIERDSDNNLDLVEYSSYNTLTYTLVGTAPSAAAIGNTVMRALIDEEATADGLLEYQAVYTSDTKVAITVQNGYTAAKNGPIKPFKTTATFGAFAVGAVRTDDS